MIRDAFDYSPESLRIVLNDGKINFLKNSSHLEIMSLKKLSFDTRAYHGANSNIIIPHNNGTGFKYEELVLANYLEKKGFLTSGYRHGGENECDIVDEKQQLQIEVVLETKTSGDILEEMIFSGSESARVEGITDALKEKFDKKDYSDKYKKGICILSFGNRDAMAMTAAYIKNNILDHYGKQSKNYFEEIFLFLYNILEEKYYFLHVNKRNSPRLEVADSIPKFIHKEDCVDTIDDNSWYEVELSNEYGDKITLIEKGERIKLVTRGVFSDYTTTTFGLS